MKLDFVSFFFFSVQVQRNIWNSKNIWFVLGIFLAENLVSFHKLITHVSLFLEGRCYVVYYVTHPGLIKTCSFTMRNSNNI